MAGIIEADYVIVGAGSAGCVLAARLSEGGKFKVVLLEAGGDDRPTKNLSQFASNLMIHIPVGYSSTLKDPKVNWLYQTEPDPGTGGRTHVWPRGKVLGGSSSINGLLYIRGQHADYDGWRQLGCEGWGWDDVAPYFRRAEHQERGGCDWHATGGPLNVSDVTTKHPVSDAVIEACEQAGIPRNDDVNGAAQEGATYYQLTVKNGQRCSAAVAYLHPAMNRPNLQVETNALAGKVLFEGKRAVGVEYRRGKEVRILRARREIILGLGAFQTPQLLMLSGIGDGAALARHGIAVEHHLPGVGQNLQDHPDFVFGFASDNPNFTGLSWAGIQRIFKGIAQYRRERRGPMTSNVAECGGFLKTRPDLAMPDIQLHFCMAMVDDHGRKPRWGAGFSCHVCLLRPESRGSVWLQSADPAQAPAIDPNFLGAAADMEAMVAGFKTTRRLLETPALRALQTADMFTADVRSDDDIRAVLRRRVDTVYHPVGTCKMGVNDPLAVVDPALRVYGVEGLRIADASVMPTLIGGNTNAPTIMIGEKAADMIRAAALS